MGYSLQVSLNLGFTQFSTQGVSQSNVKPQLLKCVVLGLAAAGAPPRSPVEQVSTIHKSSWTRTHNDPTLQGCYSVAGMIAKF
jgi:hypothetical protein